MSLKMKSISLVAAMVAITATMGTSAIAAPKAQEELVVPDIVKQVEAYTEYKTIKKISAKGGLTGWVMTKGPGNNITVYTPKDNSVVVLGNMIDKDGKNLTKDYSDEYGVKVDFKKAWNELEKATTLSQVTGSAKASIYVFMDPNCGYCHLAYKALTPYTAAGLEVKWVPVAFLSADSADKAAFLINSTDKNKALDALSDNFGKKDTSAVTNKVTPEIRVALSKNSDIMKSVGFGGTPGIIYKDKDGTIKGIGGMFKLSQIPEFTGLPFIPNKDPSLKKFE